MLLIITNSTDATADFLEREIANHGLAYLRFDTDRSLEGARITCRDSQLLLDVNGFKFTSSDVLNVWYRRPEQIKHLAIDDSPEGKFVYGEWAEALEGFFAHIPVHKWMNHPALNVAASHKIEQLSTARRLGFTVPATLVTQDPHEVKNFYSCHSGEIIVKPMGRGYIERPEDKTDSLVYTSRVYAEHLCHLDDVPSCPTLFQEYVSKHTDVRITVVDDDVHAVALFAHEEDGSQRCDIRRNNMTDVTYSGIELPSDISAKIKLMMKHYKLRFAAIDMVIGLDDTWFFLEINPNGQWAWLDEAGSSQIARSFVTSFGRSIP